MQADHRRPQVGSLLGFETIATLRQLGSKIEANLDFVARIKLGEEWAKTAKCASQLFSPCSASGLFSSGWGALGRAGRLISYLTFHYLGTI